MVGYWLAIPAILLTIIIVYYTLFKILKLLYREHFAWFVAFVIFLLPFGYVLFQARSLLDLMWVLLLTPFYGIFVLFIVSTWLAKFYCLAFAALLMVWFLFQRKKALGAVGSDSVFEAFLDKHLQGHVHFAARRKNYVHKVAKKAIAFAQGLSRIWSLLLSAFLLILLASTFVNTTALANPSYSEAQQFVSSDKTGSHPYVKGTYTCSNFAADFRTNALKAGYNCGYAFVYFPFDQSHVLDCFNTTDKGLVFVEPQWEKFVNITVGKPYQIENYSLSVDNNTVLWYYIDFKTASPTP